MAESFKVVLLKHGYPSTHIERGVVERAGGRLVDTDPLSEEEALCECENADAVIVRWLKITPAIIQRFRKCKIIVRYGIGFDNVDLAAATSAGIIVGHVPTYCVDDVAAHAIALWLSCVRRITETHEKLRAGGWDDNPPRKVYRTAGKTFGIIGLGNLGSSVAQKLQGWNMRLLACDPYVDPAKAARLNVELVGLPALLALSEYVSLHVPLLPETRHLMNIETLAGMKPGSILINTARGPVVDNSALLSALDSGAPVLAGFDVFEEEPLPIDSPLRKHPRMVLTDHMAWYSEESLAELQQTAAEEAVRVCTGGLPKAIANLPVLERLGRTSEWKPPEHVLWQFKRLAAT